MWKLRAVSFFHFLQALVMSNPDSKVCKDVATLNEKGIQILRGRNFPYTAFDFAVYSSGDKVSNHIRRYGTWEPMTGHLILKILSHFGGDDASSLSFIDIGANIGWYTFLAASKGYSVLSFEPFSSNQFVQSVTTCLNPSMSSNVRRFRFALGNTTSTNEKCDMYQIPSRNFGDTHSACGLPHVRDQRRREIMSYFRNTKGTVVKLDTVNIRKLDEVVVPILRETNGISILKIDVEGSELKVMSSARKLLTRYPPKVVLTEYLEPLLGDDYEPYAKFMHSFGFRMHQLSFDRDMTLFVHKDANLTSSVLKEMEAWAVRKSVLEKSARRKGVHVSV